MSKTLWCLAKENENMEGELKEVAGDCLVLCVWDCFDIRFGSCNKLMFTDLLPSCISRCNHF